jgi:hypothetical protein
VASWPKPTENELGCRLPPRRSRAVVAPRLSGGFLRCCTIPSRRPTGCRCSTYPFQGKRYWARPGGVRADSVSPKGQGREAPLRCDGGRCRSTRAPQRFERPDLSATFRAPGNAIERLVVEVWSELLGIREIGVDDDFLRDGRRFPAGHPDQRPLSAEIGGRFVSAQVARSSNPGGAEPSHPGSSGWWRWSRIWAVEFPGITHRQPPQDELPAETIDALLARFLDRGDWRRPNRDSARGAATVRTFPLSHAQQRQWFLEQLAPGSVHLLPNAVRLAWKAARRACWSGR